MAESNSTGAEKRISELGVEDLERIGTDLTEVCILIHTLLKSVRTTDSDERWASAAACEKAGFLADRSAQALGQSWYMGSWEAWAGVEVEASHG